MLRVDGTGAGGPHHVGVGDSTRTQQGAGAVPLLRAQGQSPREQNGFEVFTPAKIASPQSISNKYKSFCFLKEKQLSTITNQFFYYIFILWDHSMTLTSTNVDF